MGDGGKTAHRPMTALGEKKPHPLQGPCPFGRAALPPAAPLGRNVPGAPVPLGCFLIIPYGAGARQAAGGTFRTVKRRVRRTARRELRGAETAIPRTPPGRHAHAHRQAGKEDTRCPDKEEVEL